MPHQLSSYLEWVALISVSIISAIRGSIAERTGAALILAVNLASDVAFVITAPHVPQVLLFCLDLLLAIGLLAIAFWFSSLWLGAAMLLQSIILFAHALAFADGEITSFGFVIMNNLISWLMYACLLGATLMSWRARSQDGVRLVGKSTQSTSALLREETIAL